MREYTKSYIHPEVSKSVIWIGTSRADLQALQADARHELGLQLREVQRGRFPTDWRPMTTVGPGVVEIRVHAGGAFRLLYVAKFSEAVCVLHVFPKKSQKTSTLDLALARARYSLVLRTRQER